MCIIQIINQLNMEQDELSFWNELNVCILHGSFSFPLSALRKGHKVKFMQLAAFHNCLQSWIKTSFLRPLGWKPALFQYSGCLSFTSLSHNSAMTLPWWVEMDVKSRSTIGDSSKESLNKTLTLEMEVAWGTQSPVDYSPSIVCNLLMARDLWVLWTSLRSFTTPMASHRGLSEPRPAS